ncbi:rhodopsin, partial [Clonorchis sinensis]
NGFVRKTRHWFTVNLAVADLGLTISCCFPLKAISLFRGKWIWGKVGCDFYGFAGGLFGFTSITTLAAVAYLRYWTIAHVQPWPYAVTNRNATYVLLLIWLWSALWTILPFFGIGRYVMEGFLTGCAFDYLSNDWSSILFSSCLFLGGFVCPFTLICFSYARILWLIRKSKQSLTQTEKVDRKICGNPTAYRKVSFRTVKTTSILISMYLVAWGPYAVVTLLSVFGYHNHLTPMGTELPGLFAKTSALYNPIVYMIRNGSFRRTVAKRRQRSQHMALKQPVDLSVIQFSHVQSSCLRRNSSSSHLLWQTSGSRRSNQHYLLLYQMRETRAAVTDQIGISVFSVGNTAIGCHTDQSQEAFGPMRKSPGDCLHDANTYATKNRH